MPLKVVIVGAAGCDKDALVEALVGRMTGPIDRGNAFAVYGSTTRPTRDGT